jgi:hypothetical protein
VPPIVVQLIMGLLAVVFGLYFAGALLSGKVGLPQRFGPSVVVDRQTKPGPFWTAVVVAGVVCAFCALIAVVGPMKMPVGRELVGIGDECLSVQGGLKADATPVELRPCVGGTTAPYQFWTAANGQILGTGSGKCLEVKGDGSADGEAVDIATCSGAPGQRWTVQGTQIVGPGGKCLDVQNGGSAEISPIDLASCDAQPRQSWQAHEPY